MGNIYSISLPSGVTCRKDCECNKKCYAKRLERIRKTVKESYQINLNILKENPNLYWREVEGVIMTSRYFRFHVSGDIPDAFYLQKMIDIANRNQHCEILCFTKKYDIVNDWLSNHGEKLPNNLHIVFSVWRMLKCDNRFILPEAHVLYRDGSTTARDDAIKCGGNCTECAKAGEGCWVLKNGQQILFAEH